MGKKYYGEIDGKKIELEEREVPEYGGGGDEFGCLIGLLMWIGIPLAIWFAGKWLAPAHWCNFAKIGVG